MVRQTHDPRSVPSEHHEHRNKQASLEVPADDPFTGTKPKPTDNIQNRFSPPSKHLVLQTSSLKELDRLRQSYLPTSYFWCLWWDGRRCCILLMLEHGQNAECWDQLPGVATVPFQ